LVAIVFALVFVASAYNYRLGSGLIGHLPPRRERTPRRKPCPAFGHSLPAIGQGLAAREFRYLPLGRDSFVVSDSDSWHGPCHCRSRRPPTPKTHRENEMTATTCVHCNTTLTAADVDSGWCDSCGKRLPGGPKTPAKHHVAADESEPAPATG